MGSGTSQRQGRSCFGKICSLIFECICSITFWIIVPEVCFWTPYFLKKVSAKWAIVFTLIHIVVGACIGVYSYLYKNRNRVANTQSELRRNYYQAEMNVSRMG